MRTAFKITAPLALLLLFTLGAMGHTAEADSQRLRPWASLPEGAAPADEAALPAADWTSAHHNACAPRLTQTINSDWTFNYYPAGKLDESLAAPAFGDEAWPAVSLPHTWHTYESTGEPHPFTMHPSEKDSAYWWHGWGVYRKRFKIDADSIKGRRVFAEFDGVMKYCKVYLNGKYIGEHKGGYASFYFDLTGQLNAAGDNVLAVAVNARRDDVFHTPPMNAGNFNVYGGIYRDVRLVVKNAVHIPFQGSYKHEGGTFITTPKIDEKQAEVRVRTWVQNTSAEACEVSLKTIIRDAEGREVASDNVSASVAAGENHEFDQPSIKVRAPRLWSPETPALYSVLSEVSAGGNVVDRYESPLGFRTFAWDYQANRALLNGKMIHIHGTNRHQEFPWLGDAIPKWMHVRDLLDMRFGQGHNFARFCHYTQDALVYDLADRYGLLVCEETPSIKNLAFSPEVQRQQVIEMIRRDRNHPSIVMWSMGNETEYPADSAWAHAEDDTRILHLRHGNAQRAGAFITHTDQNMDMENLLRCTVRGWTDRSVADLQPKSNQSTGTEEWQHACARVEGASQRGRIDMPNGNMWIYADHGADREYSNSPLRHINPKGWVDLYRIPKYLYYLWQANYASEPMVFIHPHPWQAKNLGKAMDIVVDSNCDEVELKVNGRRVGTRQPSAANFFTVTFKGVKIEQGALEAVGRRDGKSVATRVVMSGEPARLTLRASHPALAASRDAVVVLTADVIDAAGVPVQAFTRDLEWKVEGPARLLTPAAYASDINRRGEMSGVFYIAAPVCSLIRSTGEAGEVRVTVSSKGLAPATLKLKAAAAASATGFVREQHLKDAGRKPLAHDPAVAAATEKAAAHAVANDTL